jgi:hypothetical protein
VGVGGLLGMAIKFPDGDMTFHKTYGIGGCMTHYFIINGNPRRYYHRDDGPSLSWSRDSCCTWCLVDILLTKDTY